MTALDTSFESGASDAQAAPRFMATVSRLAAMSWPIMLGAAVMALLHTGQAGLLGNIEDRQPLYLLSMLQPWYLLFFAFLEALAITGQVFSAKSKSLWPRGGLKVSVPVLSVLALAVLAALLGLVELGQGLLVSRFALLDEAAFAVLPQYLLSLAPFLLFEILNGSLRGQGRTLPGFAVLAAAVVINLATAWYLLNEQGLGIEALFAANLVSGAVAAVLIAGVFLLQMRGAGPAPLVPSVIRTATLLAVVGAPVFFSMIVSFFSSAVLFDRMAEFGQEQAAGFLLSVRFRFFLLIPATALATALAVMVNQAETESPARRSLLLSQGCMAVLAIYGALVAGLYAAYPPLVALMAEAPEIRQAANGMLRLLLPTYLLVAFVVFAHVILENLGRGPRVLAWSLLLETATVYALWTYGTDIAAALHILIASAVVYGTVFALEFALLVRVQARTPAHDGAGAAQA
ncbi:MATE family efflux transporter [Leisingera thetidis]|uniref:MATE family efflux transporter n=1 Tax=Leisingera thetidis TaxID=2930199 RepID=UPI0021F6B5FB|nr:MATE family efflux transporter [Leisingera thetidis]